MPETKALDPKPIPLITILSDLKIKKRFEEILGKRAAAFTSSVLSLYNANEQLREADPGSIVQAAVIAATMDLPINQNLGFAFIIPYGKKAQFQMGWKGFVQLAIRTRKYKTINASEVYKDEMQSWNPLTGVFEPTPFETWKLREKADFRNVVGYLSYFKLLDGFEKTLYMTNEQLIEHGTKYSKSFKTGLWTLNPHVMKIKTVVKLLLSKWGILSVEMEKALEIDQAVVGTSGEITYDDNPHNEPKPQEPSKPAGADKKISEDQFKLLCSRVDKAGINPEEVKDFILMEFKKEHRHDLTIEELTVVLRWLEKAPEATQ